MDMMLYAPKRQKGMQMENIPIMKKIVIVSTIGTDLDKKGLRILDFAKSGRHTILFRCRSVDSSSFEAITNSRI